MYVTGNRRVVDRGQEGQRNPDLAEDRTISIAQLFAAQDPQEAGL